MLASLGKTRLRPGGKEATDRIIKACNITKDTKVLEVAPNMGTTAIHLAKTFGCHVTGIDIHAESVEKAKENIRAHNLNSLIDIQHGNALNLPFDDCTFDVVMNEAMLTMLPNEQKTKAISEYYRVLKPGGRLATHDLLLKQDPSMRDIEERLKELRKLLVVNAQPLTEEGWKQIFNNCSFNELNSHTGKMTLLTLKGLIVDEGWDKLIEIINNAKKR
ncbi:MAG: class I SAM-dependent methyltransferase [Bacillaceae bacterium]|nr:class I SAM-dependent methyltransferase [Bacillaceae bacterium]